MADYPPDARHPPSRAGAADVARASAQAPEESLSAYSGGLFAEFWSPAMLSPLNDLKGQYLEVANPFLSRAVVVACHAMPESLRGADGR